MCLMGAPPRSPRHPWPLFALLTALLGTVAAVLLLPTLGGRSSEDLSRVREGIAARNEGTASLAAAPRVAGQVGADQHVAGSSEAPASSSAPAEESADRMRHRPSRLVDAATRAIPRARVTIGVEQHAGIVEVNLSTDEQGRVDLRWPEGRVVGLKVTVPGPSDEISVVVRQDEAGIDLSGLDTIVLEDLVFVPVRTVDRWGAPQRSRRVLYRMPVTSEGKSAWWESATNAEGRTALGAFSYGALLELRLGPRGLAPGAILDPAGWQRAVADGREVEVLVPRAPRLKLEFPDAGPSDSLPISVLDLRSGEPVFPPLTHAARSGVYTAPDFAEDIDLGVVVGPLGDGRYARLVHVIPTEEPVSVTLNAGVPLTGSATAWNDSGPLQGSVRAYGVGFAVEVPLGDDGRFSFRGVPDEPLTVVGTAQAAGDDARALGGFVRRVHEQHVDLRLVRLVRVRGVVLEMEGDEARPSRSLARLRAVSETLPRAVHRDVPCGSHFDIELLPGLWRLSVATVDGSAQASYDLGELRADREDLVLLLK